MNDTNTNRLRNLGFFFDDTVRRLSDKVAIVDLFGGRERTSTYRQLDERMDRVPRMLAALGVRPGERVAMLIGNRVELIEPFFGAMRAGTFRCSSTRGSRPRRCTAHHRRRVRADDRRSACNQDALSIAAGVPARHGMLLDQEQEGFVAFETEMAKPASAVAPPQIADDAQAFQPYTSGSTGRPKGAIMTHHGMLW